MNRFEADTYAATVTAPTKKPEPFILLQTSGVRLEVEVRQLVRSSKGSAPEAALRRGGNDGDVGSAPRMCGEVH